MSPKAKPAGKAKLAKIVKKPAILKKMAKASAKAPAKEIKLAPKASLKAVAKASNKSEKTAMLAAAPGEPGAPDAEELEEAEAERASTSAGGNEAALAAASSTTEMSASFKNFRHHPDMENFYRFIYENDLRHEALAIMDTIQNEKQARRAAKSGKLSAH